jgi:hypothetical protein
MIGHGGINYLLCIPGDSQDLEGWQEEGTAKQNKEEQL